MYNLIQKIFFETLKSIVVGRSLNVSLYASLKITDWNTLYKLAKQQGVVAILFEGIQQLPKEAAPPLNLLMQWSAQTFSIEDKQDSMGNIAADFAQLMAEHGIRTMVLKGKSFSTYYLHPNHRECGDLDCYLLGRYADGNRIVLENGGAVEDSGYKHSHIEYKGLTIENHQFLTSFDNTKRGIYTERMLQKLIAEGGSRIDDTDLWNPSCHFNALFMLKHALRHFLEEGIVIRHVLDWAYFLKVEQNNVDWNIIYAEMEKCRLRKFADVLTHICVEHLGVELTNPLITYTLEEPIADAVLDDIMSGFHVVKKETLIQKIGRILHRFKRMWRFRSLANENYMTLLWNSFAFSSYLRRKVKL